MIVRVACSMVVVLIVHVPPFLPSWSDGQKMSKRLKNYPDPVDVVKKFGADALRLYLVNSPVVRAESLRFQEKGVKDVVKDVFLPWFNAYRFLIQNIQRLEHVSWVTPNINVHVYIYI